MAPSRVGAVEGEDLSAGGTGPVSGSGGKPSGGLPRDRQGFGQLYHAARPAVVRYLLRHISRSDLADDLAQEAFLRAWSRPDGFAGQSSPQTYLIGIAHNLVREHRRRFGAEARAMQRFSTLPTPPPRDPAGEVGQAEDLSRLRYCLPRLSPRQRQAVELVCIQGQSVAEAARALGCSLKAVRRRLEVARARLRGQLVG
ncbi:MAG: RNA polymerase sigma factor [Phycisphaeraceae bacterium]|nr:RNA polymerase sigma factor [Phycisphaeraceae bacterium]